MVPFSFFSFWYLLCFSFCIFCLFQLIFVLVSVCFYKFAFVYWFYNFLNIFICFRWFVLVSVCFHMFQFVLLVFRVFYCFRKLLSLFALVFVNFCNPHLFFWVSVQFCVFLLIFVNFYVFQYLSIRFFCFPCVLVSVCKFPIVFVSSVCFCYLCTCSSVSSVSDQFLVCSIYLFPFVLIF